MSARLITIPFSHYCEKARWALELCGIAYEEDGHLPVFHYAATLRAGAKRRHLRLRQRRRLRKPELSHQQDEQCDETRNEGPAPGEALFLRLRLRARLHRNCRLRRCVLRRHRSTAVDDVASSHGRADLV